MTGILNAIFNLLGNIAELIVEGLVTIILKVISVVLAPIDSLIQTLFPDFGSLMVNISRLFTVILQGPVNYFLSILNNFPYLKGAIRVSLFFDITFFSVIGVYYLIHGTIILVSKIRGMIH